MKKIKDLIFSFFKSEKRFFTDVSFTLGGKVLASVTTILITPVATRIFLPKDYGEFAIYSTFVQNMVLIGGLAFPLAIFSDKKEWVSKIISLLVQSYLFWGLVFSTLLFSFKGYLDSLFETTIFNSYWFLLLISYFLTAAVGLFAALNIRLKRFKENSIVNFTDISVSKSSNLVGGIMGLGGLSFMLGEIGGKIIALIVLLRKTPSDFNLKITSLKNVKVTLVKHKEYVIYVFPSQWVTIVSNQLIIWVIAYQYNSQMLGKYSLALGLLNIPLTLLGNSFEPVISRKLVSIRDENENPLFFKKIMVLLFVLSTLCFGTVYFIPDSFYTILLGGKWEGIGIFVSVLCWPYLLLMVDQSLQNGFVVFNRKKEKLFFDVAAFISQVIVLVLAIHLEFELIQTLQSYVLVKALVYIIRITYLWKIAKSNIHE